MNQVRKGIDVTGDMDIVFYTSAPMRQDRREDREPTPATQPLPVHRTPSIDNWHQHPQANNVLRSLLPRFVQQHEARQEGGSGPHTRNTAPSGYLVGADEDEEQEEDKDEAEDDDQTEEEDEDQDREEYGARVEPLQMDADVLRPWNDFPVSKLPLLPPSAEAMAFLEMASRNAVTIPEQVKSALVEGKPS